jgi:hypothetical protein
MLCHTKFGLTWDSILSRVLSRVSSEYVQTWEQILASWLSTSALTTADLRELSDYEIFVYKREWTSAGSEQCQREGLGGGSQYKLLGPGGPQRGPRPDYDAYVFVFLGSIICRFYKLTLSNQYQVTLQLTVSVSDLV